MKNLKIYWVIIFLMIACLKLSATEIIGGSLRYESLGNQKYKIIGIVNRSCYGTPLGIPTFKVYASTTTYTLTATRTSIKDITVICAKGTPPCNPSNTTVTSGQEQHTFETTIDFSTAPYNQFYNTGKCQVFFSMEASSRSVLTTNITANTFYVEAMLDLCKLGSKVNSSLSFYIPEFMSGCYNTPFQYSDYSDDFIDGDSLSYSLIQPKKSKDSMESFIAPYGLRNPIKVISGGKPPYGMTFDSTTGNMLFVPVDTTTGAIIDIQINEYRKINNVMTLVGFSTREIFVVIKKCPGNNAPQIPTNNKQVVCEGNKLCFTIQSKDVRSIIQTVDDTTFIFWNKGIPGATFTIVDPTAREKSAQFCWQTKVGDAKGVPYRFNVVAIDNNCSPAPLSISKSFEVTVKANAQALRKYNQPECAKLRFQSFAKDTINYKGSYNYEWTIRDSINGGLPYYKTFKRLDSFKFKQNGRYVMTHIINNLPINCPSVYMDTVVVNCIGMSVKSTINASNKLNVYPNPANGFITIDLPKIQDWIEMKLINSIGQIVFTGPVNSTFDMSKFAFGVYTLEIISKDGSYTTTVVKE